ncbi:MAG: SIMPL domain-containing protein [Thaumarchaeota archaeon]|nr:SIMPL domain-containing protein [Nitrososphaerota archaeon]
MSGKIVGVSLVIAVLAIAFLGLVAFSATLSRASSQAATISTVATSSTPSTITVPGVGIASATPDQVQVVLGVTNSGTNATSVLLKNSANMTAVISSIERGVGINGSDVQTTNFNFGPTYAYNSNTINGYQASNNVQVTLQGRDLSKLDSVINAAVNAGVNQIQSIQYTLSNSLQTQLQNQALKNAIESANQTALLTASSEGVKITGIQSVSVQGSNYQQPYYSYGNAVVFASASTVSYSVPIAPGQTQFSMQVQVTYLLGQ